MQAMCKTCPFADDGDMAVRVSVMSRLMKASQHCHSTGWPKATHLCRGARDHQLMIFYCLGFLDEPTDEAWVKRLG